jgi:hypothetical protein
MHSFKPIPVASPREDQDFRRFMLTTLDPLRESELAPIPPTTSYIVACWAIAAVADKYR